MGCCGGARRGVVVAGERGRTEDPRRRPRFTITFEYRGATALTVTGPATGRRYRFERPGARLVVDPRDRPGLARVPRLHEVE